ncbi:MAG: UDP-N-acetylglucosamine--undecaprenyl-phosphate N-acetylglucosaminephosphotransferase [Psychrobium sp.]|nr:UDP-N-acetylglucosamine--undecaprenyl-phosphate N-acetylglucosaminephosphotransferase [Psychrobium sp.]
MDFIVPLLVAFLTSFIFIKLCKPIAIKHGLVDTPNARKLHLGSVPLVGGVAVFVGVAISSVIYLPMTQSFLTYLFSAAFIVLVGVIDDYKDLPVKARIFAQITVGCLMVFVADLHIADMGDLIAIGNIELGVFGYLFTVFAVVGAINAYNMVDGIDGLVGMLSIIAFTTLAILLGMSNSQWFLLPMFFVSATLAYLMFNLQWPKNKLEKIFMGDAGSMLIGFTIVWLLVVAFKGDAQVLKPATALWIVAVPLMDMAAIMIRRVRKGQSPFKPDRDHLHHIFMRAGFSSKQTLFFISCIATALTTVGIILEKCNTPEWFTLSLFMLLFLAYTFAINHIWRLLTLFRKILR